MKKKQRRISLIYKLLICIIGLVSIIFTSGALDGEFNARVFTMFTTISNILCIIYFAVDILYMLLNPNEKTDVYPIFKHMITLSITLTCIIAAGLLDLGFDFNSYTGLSLIGLHYIIPIMVILDWIIFEKKGTMKKYEPFAWLIVPTIYFILAELSARIGNGFGVIVGEKYPYFFLDVDKYGTMMVLLNSLLIGIGCLVVGYLYYFIDKKLKDKK